MTLCALSSRYSELLESLNISAKDCKLEVVQETPTVGWCRPEPPLAQAWRDITRVFVEYSTIRIEWGSQDIAI